MRSLILVLLCCAGYFAATAMLNKALASSDSFAQIALQTFPDSAATQLAALPADKPLYVKMWASWCKPCMEQMPHFQALYQQYGDKVNFVAVNIDINEKAEAIDAVIKQFGLTMPVWLDTKGQLAVALSLVGTPYSVLINSQQQQVYTSHESDAVLDGFLQRLAAGQQLPAAPSAVLTAAAQQKLLAPYLTGEHTLFFTATWCDWYLADSRPLMSKACSDAQKGLNQLAAEIPRPPLKVIVNHLWTDDKAVAEFNDKYQLKLPVSIDEHGVLFRQFSVRSIPVLMQVKDGKVVTTITDFSQPDEPLKHLK